MNNYISPADKELQDKNTFKILQINIRSIKRNLSELNNLLVDYKLIPDIITLSETWLKTTSKFNPYLQGYNYINGKLIKKVGGVGIFIKDNLRYRQVDNYLINADDTEELWIEIINPTGKNTLIGSIYRHPNKSTQMQFQKKFEKTIFKLNKLRHNYFINGDFNVNLLNPSNIDFINSLTGLGCNQLVNFPTHYNRINSSLIDHIYTNCQNKSIKTKFIKEDITDHYPILMLLKDHNLKNSKYTNNIKKRDFKNFSQDNFLHDLHIEMEEILSSNNEQDINTLFNKFISKFLYVTNFHAPLKKMTRKQIKLKNNPWLTKGILKSIKTKKKLYIASIETNNPVAKYNYKTYSKKLSHVKEAAKTNHYSHLIQKSSRNTKLIWKTINDILKYKTKKSKDIHSIRCEDNKIATEPFDIGNTLNNYFNSIGSNLGKSCGDMEYKDNIAYIHNSLYLKPITNSEISNLLDKIDINKSSGPDDPPNKLVKIAKTIITPILTKLYNLCLDQGIFPDVLKTAAVIPIHKSGNDQSPNNYRPISLISTFSKILEKLIYKRTYEFLEKYSIIHRNQFGFRKNFSTEMAVTQIYENLVKTIEDKKVSCSVFLDIRKAFDSVNHTILINKLYKYGIRGIPLKLFCSFLNNRQQFVIIKGIKSNNLNVTTGVPQGSVLGPLLFLLFINDLPTVSGFSCSLFADDACLGLSDSCPKSLESNVNKELIKISNWMKTNKICINYGKTVFMIVTNKTLNTKFQIQIDNSNIEEVKSAKYLGVIIDNKLNWKNQIDSVTKKLSTGCWAIAKLRPFVNLKTLKTIYYTLIYPHLQYCISSWGSAAGTNLKKLETKHNRIVKIMTHSPYLTTANPLFAQLNILQIKDILTFKTAMAMHRMVREGTLAANQIIPLNIKHTYNTRSKSNANCWIPSVRTDFGKSLLKYNGPTIWNEVPIEIKKLSTIAFKHKYKDIIINKYWTQKSKQK